MAEKSAAVVTIRRPGSMTLAGRKAIANWLRKQASMLEEYGEDYTNKTYRARYLYE